MTVLRPIAVAFATIAAACALAAPGDAAGCARTGYSYAGIRAATPVRGLAATLSMAAAPLVTSGHVAGWLGVSGDAGWLQIGISSVPGGRTELYYESRVAGADPVYEPLGRVGVGSSHRVAVLEGTTPDLWTAWLDGRPVSPGLQLPGSHAAWLPLATTETYDGGATRCNSFAFQFGRLQSAAPTGIWQPLATARRFADRGLLLWTPTAGAVLIARP